MLTIVQSTELPFILWAIIWLQFPVTTKLKSGSLNRADWDGQYLAIRAKSELLILMKREIILQLEVMISW